MWNDPIVEEIRNVRNEHERKFNYNLQAIVNDLKKQQKTSKRKYITLPPRKPAVMPKAKIKKD